jgi:pimeloyl-ACP methyl ester carboxylesterase
MYDKFTTPGQARDDGGLDWVDIAPFDELLDEISLYWFTNSGGSAARMYWESWGKDFGAFTSVDLPVGFTVFPREIFRAPRVWAERAFPNLVHWGEADRGGHFAAWEQPGIFVDELRASFRAVRARPGV